VTASQTQIAIFSEASESRFLTFGRFPGQDGCPVTARVLLFTKKKGDRGLGVRGFKKSGWYGREG